MASSKDMGRGIAGAAWFGALSTAGRTSPVEPVGHSAAARATVSVRRTRQPSGWTLVEHLDADGDVVLQAEQWEGRS